MDMGFTSFKIQEKYYPVAISRKKTKRIVMKIDPLFGIVVSCPLFCSDNTVARFLESNRSWLEKSLQIHEENERKLGVSACSNYQKTFLFGEPYRLQEKADLKKYYEITEGVIYYKGNPVSALDRLRKDHYSYIERVFEEMKQAFSGKIKQNPFLTIRKMKSRWGSCNNKTGRITVNRVLVHLPPRLIRFIMVHEFTHLIYPNHGKAFKSFLEKQMPDYRKLEKELKNYIFLLKID